MTADAVLAVIRDAIGIVMELDPAGVLPAQRLAGELGADSLAIVEIIEIVEEELARSQAGFVIADEDLDGFDTVQELLDYCLARLSR